MRYPITVDVGTTLRFGLKPYTEENDVKTYLTPTEVSKLVFKLRNSEYDSIAYQELEFIDDTWQVHLSPEQTVQMSAHRAFYYVIDITYPSSDVIRLLEGPVKVKPVGGYNG